LLRVSPSHDRLLEAWQAYLNRREYLEAQSMPWDRRPPYLLGDQDVLCALLESTEFADVPVHFFRRGEQIAQCFQNGGYMFHEMIANLVRRRRPPLVHSQGLKPWSGDQLYRLHLELSPYSLLAREYAAALDEPTEWMHPTLRRSRGLIRAARSSPWTASLPLAAYREVRYQPLARSYVKRRLRKD
jgi:hypothetical protein